MQVGKPPRFHNAGAVLVCYQGKWETRKVAVCTVTRGRGVGELTALRMHLRYLTIICAAAK